MGEILLLVFALLFLGAMARGIKALADIVNMMNKALKPRRKPPPPLPKQ